MKKEKDEDLEIIIGDDSNLEISEAKDCLNNNLRPKNKKNLTNKVVVPKTSKNK